MPDREWQLSLGPSQNLALSADGKLLAVFGGRHRTFPSTTSVDVYDTRSGKRLLHTSLWKELRSTRDQHLLAFLPDGKAVVAGAYVWDSSAVGYSVDVKVVEVPSGKVLKEFKLPEGRGMQGIVTAAGKTLIVSSLSEVAALYDLATGKEVDTLTGPERSSKVWPTPPAPLTVKELQDRQKGEAARFAVTPDGKWLAVGTKDGWISVWNLPPRRRLWRKEGSSFGTSGLDISPNAMFVVSIDPRSNGIIWRRSDGGRRLERPLPG